MSDREKFLRREDFKFDFNGYGVIRKFDICDKFIDVISKINEVLFFINTNNVEMFNTDGLRISHASIDINCDTFGIVVNMHSEDGKKFQEKCCFAEIRDEYSRMYDKFGVIKSSYMKNGKIISEMFFASCLDDKEICIPIASYILDNYGEYLKTHHWKQTRVNKLRDSDFKCQLCGVREEELHVHHNNYDNLFFEESSDLIVLCKDCHSKFHNK